MSHRDPKFEAVLEDVVGYWEIRRPIYNVVLVCLVVFFWGQEIASSSPIDWMLASVFLLGLAFVANLLYCAALPIDALLQLTPLSDLWKKLRWMLFVGGQGLACTLALCLILHQGMA